MLMPLGDPEADLPLQFVLDDVDGPSVMRLTFALAEESPESAVWKWSEAQWWQILEELTEREGLLQEMGEMRGLNVVANAPLLKVNVIWSAELPITAQLRKETGLSTSCGPHPGQLSRPGSGLDRRHTAFRGRFLRQSIRHGPGSR